MTVLNSSDAIRLGSRQVTAIYRGSVRVWPAAVTHLTGIIYSQSDVYAPTVLQPADYAGMNNGDASGTGNQTACNPASPAFIMADCGKPMWIDHIMLGYDYLNNLYGGWGPGYAQAAVEVSDDNVTWKTLGRSRPYDPVSGGVDGIQHVPVAEFARYIRFAANGWLALTEFQVWGGPDKPSWSRLTGVTYSQTSVYSPDNTPATYAGMNDGRTGGTETALSGELGWVQADCGSVLPIDHVVVGWDVDPNDHMAGGWGQAYCQDGLVQGSVDGVNWTSHGSQPAYASTTSINGLWSIPVGGDYRYVRLARLENNQYGPWLAVPEFEIWGNAMSGHGTAQEANCEVAELLIWDLPLTDAERVPAEDLKTKWGL